jgi:type IV pilus assembly protein PilY1
VYWGGANAVSWATNNGWYIDFPVTGERSSPDPSLGLGPLVFTAKPQTTSTDPCGAGAVNNATSYVLLPQATTPRVRGQRRQQRDRYLAGVWAFHAPVLVKLADGSVRALIRRPHLPRPPAPTMGATVNLKAPITQTLIGNVRRVSWRELNGM